MNIIAWFRFFPPQILKKPGDILQKLAIFVTFCQERPRIPTILQISSKTMARTNRFSEVPIPNDLEPTNLDADMDAGS